MGKMLFEPIAGMLKTYILRQGFRDGFQGLIIAIMGSYYAFLRNVKLWELWNKGEGDGEHKVLLDQEICGHEDQLKALVERSQ